jgi:hypothetical protein
MRRLVDAAQGPSTCTVTRLRNGGDAGQLGQSRWEMLFIQLNQSYHARRFLLPRNQVSHSSCSSSLLALRDADVPLAYRTITTPSRQTAIHSDSRLPK